MMQRLNNLLDRVSEYLAHRKGLLPIIGLIFVILNGILQFIPSLDGIADTHVLLHIGVIISILGILIAWAL
jgi:hypothetical protein